MSTVPKVSNNEFWMERAATARVLTLPADFAPPIPKTADRPVANPRIGEAIFAIPWNELWKLSVRYELSISIAALIALACAVSIVANSRIGTNFEVRESRATLSEIRQDIGRLNAQLEAVSQEYADYEASDYVVTYPIDPEKVPEIELKPLR